MSTPYVLTPIQEEWVKTLETTDIKQNPNYLGFTDGSRCCLGILCDLAVKHGVIPEPILIKHSHYSEDIRPYEDALAYG